MAETKRAKYHVRVRKFLNRDPQLPAYVIGIVRDTSDIPDEDESWKWGEIILDFGDCYRRVSFDFQMDSPEDRCNSLFKINRLARVVNLVRDAIEKEVHARNNRPPERRQEKD